jgi:circadian clock protein KaiC
MKKKGNFKPTTIPKSLTGITGLDEITLGGLPKGRPTLIAGSAGSGKTLMAMEFIVRGALDFNEPGVFVSFEESPEELIANVRSLGFDLDDLIKKGLMDVDYIHVEKSEIEETGEFDLEGLFIRLNYIIDSIGAKRIALDTLESLFSGIQNHAILRAELRRLFRWLKNKGVTAVISGEKGEKTLTRQGLEEYVSDCVIFLDHRIEDQYGTRRLRIVKYRGSFHGTNEYPFLINKNGISVIPITSIKLDHEVSKQRVSTGIESLDEMFGGKGFYRGSTILISGTAGSGKTSMLSSFINSQCSGGEKCLFVALEESKDQIIRNMSAIGIDLKQWEDKGLLKFHVSRPTYHSLEMHLALMHQLMEEFNPAALVIDPISNFTNVGNSNEAGSLLTRLIDFIKMKKITAVMANLTSAGSDMESTDVNISSIVDTWILLRGIENNGERNRTIYILKSRGMKHSNQVREFLISEKGIKLIDVFIGEEGVLVGSARKTREKLNKEMERQRELERKNLELNINRLKEVTEAKISALKSEYETQIFELKKNFQNEASQKEIMDTALKQDAVSRQAEKKQRNSRRNGK